MALFRRSPAAGVAVSPAVASPRQTVTATVTTATPVKGARSATLDWGYTNFYRYHWAGHADSAAATFNDELWLTGEVGTNYGGARDTDEWVSVAVADLALAADEFTGATAQFRVPSWAPPSSKEIARWSCRLRVDRGGRDVEAHGDFTVTVRRADVQAQQAAVEHYDGAAETAVDIELASPVFAAGEVIRGRILLHSHADLPDGDLRVTWQRERLSHPLTRRPVATAPIDGPAVKLGNRIPLRAGHPIAVPFELPLPADAAPTASAVHSSMSWFVAAQLFYAGFTSHMTERARRPIIVVNC